MMRERPEQSRSKQCSINETPTNQMKIQFILFQLHTIRIDTGNQGVEQNLPASSSVKIPPISLSCTVSSTSAHSYSEATPKGCAHPGAPEKVETYNRWPESMARRGVSIHGSQWELRTLPTDAWTDTRYTPKKYIQVQPQKKDSKCRRRLSECV